MGIIWQIGFLLLKLASFSCVLIMQINFVLCDFFCIYVLHIDYICPPSSTCPIHSPALRTLLGWGTDSHRKAQHHHRGNRTSCWAWWSLLPYLCALVSVWTSFVRYCYVPISHPLLTIEVLMNGSIFLFLLKTQEKAIMDSCLQIQHH